MTNFLLVDDKLISIPNLSLKLYSCLLIWTSDPEELISLSLIQSSFPEIWKNNKTFQLNNFFVQCKILYFCENSNKNSVFSKIFMPKKLLPSFCRFFEMFHLSKFSFFDKREFFLFLRTFFSQIFLLFWFFSIFAKKSQTQPFLWHFMRCTHLLTRHWNWILGRAISLMIPYGAFRQKSKFCLFFVGFFLFFENS